MWDTFVKELAHCLEGAYQGVGCGVQPGNLISILRNCLSSAGYNARLVQGKLLLSVKLGGHIVTRRAADIILLRRANNGYDIAFMLLKNPGVPLASLGKTRQLEEVVAAFDPGKGSHAYADKLQLLLLSGLVERMLYTGLHGTINPAACTSMLFACNELPTVQYRRRYVYGRNTTLYIPGRGGVGVTQYAPATLAVYTTCVQDTNGNMRLLALRAGDLLYMLGRSNYKVHYPATIDNNVWSAMSANMAGLALPSGDVTRAHPVLNKVSPWKLRRLERRVTQPLSQQLGMILNEWSLVRASQLPLGQSLLNQLLNAMRSGVMDAAPGRLPGMVVELVVDPHTRSLTYKLHKGINPAQLFPGAQNPASELNLAFENGAETLIVEVV